MKTTRLAIVLLPAVGLLIPTSSAFAQAGGGIFGSGGSSFAGGGLGTSGLGGVGQSPVGGMGAGGGGSSFGSGSAFGQSLSGPGGQGLGGQGFGGGGGAGQGLGFGGGQGATSSGFVGRSGADVQNFFQALNPMANQAGAGTQVQRTTMNRGREANETENATLPVQVRVSVGFEVPPGAGAAARNDGTARRLNGILSRRGMGGTEVSIANGVARVAGAPPSPSERLVVERLMRLEPGVSRVVFGEAIGPETLEPTPRDSDR